MKIARLKLFVACASALTAFVGASAQGAADAGAMNMTLTIEQAVEIALSDNPTIRIADMEVQR